MRKLFITFVVFIIFAVGFLWTKQSFAVDHSVEKIIYKIAGLGIAEYNDWGLTELDGKTVRLITFRTHVFGFDDLEKIYADPVKFLPVKVERQIKFLFVKEHIIEEYSADACSVVIKKYKGERVIKEYHFKAKGAIQSAVLLPFYLRTVSAPGLGWTYYTYLPDAYKITLASIEEIKIPAGIYKAYHFVSDPRKFEVWISQDQARVPLKLLGGAGHNYLLTMKSRKGDEEKMKTKIKVDLYE
ncbi:MAG: hypothetical protein HQL26_06685 [Candidatus Omnitrophica bacterium]|nr:hypothetical protein [Candidatus Omnitrophota bacterium]